MQENVAHKNMDPILNKSGVVALIGLSKATIDRQILAGTFPKPLKLSQRRVGWRRSQIETWLNEREQRQ
jgi:prophage regulatory protein